MCVCVCVCVKCIVYALMSVHMHICNTACTVREYMCVCVCVCTCVCMCMCVRKVHDVSAQERFMHVVLHIVLWHTFVSGTKA